MIISREKPRIRITKLAECFFFVFFKGNKDVTRSYTDVLLGCKKPEVMEMKSNNVLITAVLEIYTDHRSQLRFFLLMFKNFH